MKNATIIITLVIICAFVATAQNTLLPSIAPLKGMTSKDVTRSFGKNMHPVLKVEREHHGVDFVAPVGTEVLSTADGTIAVVGENKDDGRFVQITHAKGYATRYTHLSEVTVNKGHKIKQGSPIALSGSSGASSWPHLHYEVLQKGKPVDPLKFLPSK